jgi:hypothetical protein
MPAKYTLAPYSRRFVGQNRTCALCEGRRGHDDHLNVLLNFLDNPSPLPFRRSRTDSSGACPRARPERSEGKRGNAGRGERVLSRATCYPRSRDHFIPREKDEKRLRSFSAAVQNARLLRKRVKISEKMNGSVAGPPFRDRTCSQIAREHVHPRQEPAGTGFHGGRPRSPHLMLM